MRKFYFKLDSNKSYNNKSCNKSMNDLKFPQTECSLLIVKELIKMQHRQISSR